MPPTLPPALPPSRPPPSRPPAPFDAGPRPDGGSLVLRFGTAVGLAAAAALACALPAAMRVAVALGAEGTGRAWTGLAASALVPMVATVVVLRGAREGLRAFGGTGAELRAYGAALWAVWLVVALTLYGSVLRASTHHHALAGVTFAFGALALAVGLAFASARLVTILRDASPRARRAAALGLVFITVSALAWIGVRFLRAATRDPASAVTAGMIVDILAFALAAGFAARRTLASRRALAVLGPPVAVAIAALGFSAVRDAPLRAAIDERAPAFAPVVDAVGEP